MLFFRPLLFAFLLLGASAKARFCFGLLYGNTHLTNSPRGTETLTPEEQQTFETWLDRHQFYIERLALISEETLGMILAELPDTLRAKVIRVVKDMEPYFEARGVVLGSYPIYYRLLDYFAFPKVPRILLAEERVAKYRALGEAEKRSVARHYNRIREVGQIKGMLLGMEQAEYRLKYDEEWVTFPDGTRYRYEKLRWGRRRIWVKFKNVLRTQTVIYPDTLTRYRNSARTVGRGLSEILGPDGRVLLYDGHHRVLAYAMNNHFQGSLGDVPIPFLLRGSADGHYYTVSHFRILHSPNYVDIPATRVKWEHDFTWSFLDEEQERAAFIRSCRKSQAETFREIYYRETKLPRLGEEN